MGFRSLTEDAADRELWCFKDEASGVGQAKRVSGGGRDRVHPQHKRRRVSSETGNETSKCWGRLQAREEEMK